MHKPLPPPPTASAAEHHLTHERERYAREWDVSARHFAAHQNYRWMADQLGVTGGRVLEIGCGNGASTMALAARNPLVMALDENPDCLRRAEQTLAAAGVAVDMHWRGRFRDRGGKHHDITYRAFAAARVPGVSLIEGNVLKDATLESSLAGVKFDAVVCWLIGTHNGIYYNRCIDLRVTRQASQYRQRVQAEVYKLANRLLKPGGYLHVVDRGYTPAGMPYAQAFEAMHSALALETSLAVEPLTHTVYTEPESANAIKMVENEPLSGEIHHAPTRALLSIRARKT